MDYDVKTGCRWPPWRPPGPGSSLVMLTSSDVKLTSRTAAVDVPANAVPTPNASNQRSPA